MTVSEPSASSAVKTMKTKSWLYTAYIKSKSAPNNQVPQEKTLIPVESFTFNRCLICGKYAETKISAPIIPRFWKIKSCMNIYLGNKKSGSRKNIKNDLLLVKIFYQSFYNSNTYLEKISYSWKRDPIHMIIIVIINMRGDTQKNDNYSLNGEPHPRVLIWAQSWIWHHKFNLPHCPYSVLLDAVKFCWRDNLFRTCRTKLYLA